MSAAVACAVDGWLVIVCCTAATAVVVARLVVAVAVAVRRCVAISAAECARAVTAADSFTAMAELLPRAMGTSLCCLLAYVAECARLQRRWRRPFRRQAALRRPVCAGCLLLAYAACVCSAAMEAAAMTSEGTTTDATEDATVTTIGARSGLVCC